MASPKSLVAPEKELRFTRAAQGRGFLVAAALMLVIALGVIVLATQGTEFEPPRLAGYGWVALFPLFLSWVLWRLGWRCVRHAYLIFTPLGVEIFPLWRPESQMRLYLWQEIDALECDAELRHLWLHFNAEKTAGIVVALAPIMPAQREFLRALVDARASRAVAESTS
jgi:hypothetical protein